MKKRYITLQSQDYRINLVDGIWIVGHKTPLDNFIPDCVISFITNCCYFSGIKLLSHVTHDDKIYRAHYFIRKSELSGRLYLRISIDTDGDFEYEFENF